MPRANKNAVEEESAACQRQDREDAAENFASKQVRMPECAHKSQGEQHQPERDHRQVRPRKTSNAPVHTAQFQLRFIANASPHSIRSKTSNLSYPGARI